MSDNDLEVLLNKQTELLGILEQLQLRVNKLIPPKLVNVKTNVKPAPAPLQKFSSPQKRIQKTYEKKSESEINNGIANLTDVRLLKLQNHFKEYNK